MLISVCRTFADRGAFSLLAIQALYRLFLLLVSIAFVLTEKYIFICSEMCLVLQFRIAFRLLAWGLLGRLLSFIA